ncbi:hypothetical protein CVT25_009072 [Psilocybe cyanescens]|uniref:Uncharacterized protein n=1 Tax=Psilocybe cyanescens TaxID=93625 RepID=A0A409X8A0_PSICY|nr:hypothetical protein CVT25_009072 [Psilocybe cyanescens]
MTLTYYSTTAKLSADNGGALQLSSHCEAIAVVQKKRILELEGLADATSPEVSQSLPSVDVPDPDTSETEDMIPRPNLKKCRALVSDNDKDIIDNGNPLRSTSPVSLPSEMIKRKKKKNKTKKRTSTDSNNHNTPQKPVNIQSIDDDCNSDAGQPKYLNKTKPTANIDNFFKPALNRTAGCMKSNNSLVLEHTTLCWHMDARHSQMYQKWAKDNNFDSMLPSDTKERCKTLADEIF